MIKIRFDVLSELERFEAESKDYLCNLKVEADGKNYIVNVYGITRLRQDFQTETDMYGFYIPEPNLIIVEYVNFEKIRITLENMYKEGYFDTIAEASEV